MSRAVLRLFVTLRNSFELHPNYLNLNVYYPKRAARFCPCLSKFRLCRSFRKVLRTADPGTPLIGFDFRFKIYFDFVDRDSKLPYLLALSSYEQKYQEIFEKVAAELREL